MPHRNKLWSLQLLTTLQMTWYILFESLLNFLAELTYFADRGFYVRILVISPAVMALTAIQGDWWNSVSWDQFARDWNRPVHNFLLRHVYHSSISFMRVNKYAATLITFFLSAIVHELGKMSQHPAPLPFLHILLSLL